MAIACRTNLHDVTASSLETWMGKTFREFDLDLQAQVEAHQIPTLMGTEFVFTFRIATTIKEAEAELPFLVRVKAAYKLIVDALPLAYPSCIFATRNTRTAQCLADKELALTIDNLVKYARIEEVFSVQGKHPHSSRVSITAIKLHDL